MMNDPMAFYTNLVYFLKHSLGVSCEIYLFDTQDPRLPVVATSVTVRQMEELARKFASASLKSPRFAPQGMALNQSLGSDLDKLIRGSVLFVKDAQEQVIGALCILMNCMPYLKLQEMIWNVMQFDLSEEDSQEPQGISLQDVLPAEPSLEMIQQELERIEMEPSRLTQAEKQEIICDLYDMNAFQVKGAVAKVAQGLKMSEQSVYRYIHKIKSARS